VINPAFGLLEAKGFVPHATEAATKARELRLYSLLSLNSDTSSFYQMVNKWNDVIENSKSGSSALIDVNMWLGKATLDAYVPASAFGMCKLELTMTSLFKRFGTGAFDYDFGALDEKDNQLTKSYMNVMYDILNIRGPRIMTH